MDADLLLAELEREGYDLSTVRVENAADLRAALYREQWDVVLSDYNLPDFDAPAALSIVRAFNPELPFIIVSGTVGEDVAVASLKAGAADFLLKDRLQRLVPAIEREVREAELRRTRERERQALEERLRQAQKLEGIGQLAGGIAHDFNNLLTTISGYTEMVLEQIGPDKPISQDLQEIREASDRAVALTRQLLAFSRQQRLNVVAIDVNAVLDGMRNMLQRVIREDIEIRQELAPQLPPILADRVQLEQVVINLVVNARDAMPTGGTLTLETAVVDAREVTSAAALTDVADGPFVRLRVTDTGIGMEAATLARIFEPFFTTKGVGQGTGLGLATVYGVTQQLGGHISVSSEAGQGTTFRLYFPGASEAIISPDAGTTRREPSPLATHREVVFVVEDQRAVRQLVARILKRHGYSVIEAAHPAEAFELINKGQSFDMVVTDVVMPIMSGPELVSRLREQRPNLKALYISGYTADELVRRINREAVDIVLPKPFTPDALLQAVRGVLDDLGE